MSANLGAKAYYRRDRDQIMWSEFDRLAGRLRLPVSAAITEAAREWVKAHQNDPAPETVFKPKRGDLPPGTPDPFPPVA